MRSPALPAALAAVALLAGCLASPEGGPAGALEPPDAPQPGADTPEAQATPPSRYETAYEDADDRAWNEVDGTENTRKTVNVPLGTRELRVAALLDVKGVASFRLTNPVGIVMREEQFSGAYSAEDEAWYVAEPPVPGPWNLHITGSGRLGYAFGFFLD